MWTLSWCWLSCNSLDWRRNIINPVDKLGGSLTKLMDSLKLTSSLQEERHTQTTFFSTEWCSSFTISSPSTPDAVNPLVHCTSLALASPSCLHGNEKVNPRGSSELWQSRFWSATKLSMQSAMWSNNYKNKHTHCKQQISYTKKLTKLDIV